MTLGASRTVFRYESGGYDPISFPDIKTKDKRRAARAQRLDQESGPLYPRRQIGAFRDETTRSQCIHLTLPTTLSVFPLRISDAFCGQYDETPTRRRARAVLGGTAIPRRPVAEAWQATSTPPSAAKIKLIHREDR